MNANENANQNDNYVNIGNKSNLMSSMDILNNKIILPFLEKYILNSNRGQNGSGINEFQYDPDNHFTEELNIPKELVILLEEILQDKLKSYIKIMNRKLEISSNEVQFDYIPSLQSLREISVNNNFLMNSCSLIEDKENSKTLGIGLNIINNNDNNEDIQFFIRPKNKKINQEFEIVQNTNMLNFKNDISRFGASKDFGEDFIFRSDKEKISISPESNFLT